MTAASIVTTVVPVGTFSIARPLSWLVLLTFLSAAVLEFRDRERARTVAVVAWTLFGVFWLILVPHFVLTEKSITEGLGSIAAVPLSLYAGYLLWNGRDSLFVLGRAVGLMGLLYLPFSYVPLLETNPAREWLVETVASQTAWLMSVLGADPTLVGGMEYNGITITSKSYPYVNTFIFSGNTQPITYSIILACTAIGSMAIIAGGILAVKAPFRRKLRALALSIPAIYVLNIIRNTFIAIMFGGQRMQIFEGPVMTLFGLDDPQMVSYYVADRLLAQFGSVIAMVIITWIVVRTLPEILVIVEDLLFMVTGTEYDLEDAFEVTPVVADGGES